MKQIKLIPLLLIISCMGQSQKSVEIEIYQSAHYTFCEIWRWENGSVENISTGYFHRDYLLLDSVKSEALRKVSKYKKQGYKIVWKIGGNTGQYRKLLQRNNLDPEDKVIQSENKNQ